MEATGLGIFMVSACLFGGLLESHETIFHQLIPSAFLRTFISGILMGLTALFIFYSPFTSPSGAHINPAVTITFYRLGKINKTDTLFYILFQFAGATMAVVLMQWLMGSTLTSAPVNSIVTIPVNNKICNAFIIEFIIAFCMMSMVLFTSIDDRLKKYTRIIAAVMVCAYVIIAGPVSGFGMNPARSFASAVMANIWNSFWIYLLVPVASMLLAAECFLVIQQAKNKIYHPQQ